MSQAPDTTGHPGTRRPVNLQKLNSQTGEIIWSRWLRPPFWTFSRMNANGFITSGPTAVNVEPIHGTEDVIVRLVRTNGGVLPCGHAFARVNKFGSVVWWRHHHVGETGPTGVPLFAPTNMASSSTLSPGDTFIVTSSGFRPGGSGTEYYNSYYVLSADGQTLVGGDLGLEFQKKQSLHSIPGSSVLLGFRTGSDSVPTSTYLSTMANLSVGGGTREWNSGTTSVNPIAVSQTFVVCAEEWHRGFNGSGDDQIQNGGLGKTQGILLRDTDGNYSFGSPQTDIQETLLEPACHTGDVYWRATKAATDGTRIYVFAERVTIDYWDPFIGATETAIPRLVCFSASLAENWNIALSGVWALIADDDGLIVGRANTVTAGPHPRINQIERRDHDGNVMWRQAVGNGSSPADMCFSYDGYLYVACGGVLAY